MRAEVLQKEQRKERQKYARKPQYLTVNIETFLSDVNKEVEIEEKIEEINTKRFTKKQLIYLIKQHLEKPPLPPKEKVKSYFVFEPFKSTTMLDAANIAEIAGEKEASVYSFTFSLRQEKRFLTFIYACLELEILTAEKTESILLQLSETADNAAFTKLIEELIV